MALVTGPTVGRPTSTEEGRRAATEGIAFQGPLVAIVGATPTVAARRLRDGGRWAGRRTGPGIVGASSLAAAAGR